METCISDVKQWITSDNLMLNDDKTEFIVIASQHLFKKAAVNTNPGRGLRCEQSVCSVEFGCVVR